METTEQIALFTNCGKGVDSKRNARQCVEKGDEAETETPRAERRTVPLWDADGRKRRSHTHTHKEIRAEQAYTTVSGIWRR